jgi:hypothetical protein
MTLHRRHKCATAAMQRLTDSCVLLIGLWRHMCSDSARSGFADSRAAALSIVC